MWKGPTLPLTSYYPFASLPDPSPLHLVRQRISNSDHQLEKARVQAALKHDCLIKLESAQEERGEYYLLFEYVAMSLDRWHVGVSRELIENYEQRMILFSRYLADRGIVIDFRRDHMGATETGDAKYYLEPTFQLEPGVDKLALKKRYKEQIRTEVEYYIDKKLQGEGQTQLRPMLPENKQNSSILKILEAIEKGKANLCSEPVRGRAKQSQLPQSLLPQQQMMSDTKATMRPIKNVQNITISKEINKVNRIQVMVDNKQEFRQEYASSSFYVSGLQMVHIEKDSQAKRLLSPNDKFARFEEVKYKEYKSLKTSGEIYVQDFIDVLEAEDGGGLLSPRATLKGVPGITIQNSARTTLHGSPPAHQLQQSPPQRPAIAAQKTRKRQMVLRAQAKLGAEPKIRHIIQTPQFNYSQLRKATSPKQEVSSSNSNSNVQGQLASQKGLKPAPATDPVPNTRSQCEVKTSSAKAKALQKKVSDAIANSLSAISKFKNRGHC